MEIKQGEINLSYALESTDELIVDLVYTSLDNFKLAGNMATHID